MASRASLDGSGRFSSAGKDVSDRRTGGALRGEGAALLQHGQNLYQQGHFKAATEAFTEALKDKYADVLAVLDSRSAAHSKLAQHDLALRDTKQMIKRDKSDERGYLRCAKTLLLDGKPDKALEVYAYGLKCLSKSHPRRQMIEQLHSKLQNKLSAKLYDPFSVLPLEVVTMVLQHFNFKQIVAILRVSKKWDQFLTSMRNIWLRMDLSEARGKIHWTSVRAYIRRSKGMLTQAIVKNISSPSTQRVLEYLSRCPQLDHLEFWDSHDPAAFYELFKGSKRLKTLVVSAHMTVAQERITGFLHNLPLLERIEIHSTRPSISERYSWPLKLPNLKSITLGSKELPPNALYSLALEIPGLNAWEPHSIPNLEELRLDWYGDAPRSHRLVLESGKTPNLRRLDLSSIIFHNSDEALPPNLEFLRFNAGTANFTFSNPVGPLLPNLKTLLLSDVKWVIPQTVEWFLTNTETSLRVLGLDSCFRLNNGVGDLIQNGHFANLTELNLSRLPGVDDRVIDLVLANMSNLKIVHLSYTSVTGRAIKLLADARFSGDKMSQVDRIYLKGCESVSSDAVAYGRARGVEIFT